MCLGGKSVENQETPFCTAAIPGKDYQLVVNAHHSFLWRPLVDFP